MRQILCLPLALLLLACDEKPKTQAVLGENKDTVAAAVDSSLEKGKESAECEEWVAYPKNIVDILVPFGYRIYHEGEDPTKEINNKWVSLCKDSTENYYYIKQADFSIEDGYSECVYLNTKILKSKDNVVLFMDLPHVKKGKIEHVNIPQTIIWPNDTLDFEFNGVPYRFRAMGNIIDTLRTATEYGGVFYKVKDYKLYLGTDEKPEELLFELDVEVLDGTFVQLIFIGDIDGDGIPDFIFDNPLHYEEENFTLFLSTKAEEGKITKKVAKLVILWDC